jgi:signal transduction histidine kinase
MAPRFRRLWEIEKGIAPFFAAFLIVYLKDYFSWLGMGVALELAGSLVLAGMIQLVLIILAKTTKSSVFAHAVRYVYVAFFLYFVYITGSINSSFIFTLLLPVITPAVHLNKVGTRNTGIVTTLAFASLIFFLPSTVISMDLLVKHTVQTILLGAVSYLVYSAVNETIRQNSERDEASRRITEMVQMERLKSDFLSIAQHQLRTPISGVKWALEMLKTEEKIPLESQSLIDASLERVKDALNIINQMLTTVENEGTPTLEFEDVDVAGMIRSIIAELNFVIIKKSVKITCIGPDSAFIRADRNKMKAALVNIVDNAIKYSPKGKVDVSISEAPNKVTITVKDTGIGIPDEDIPYIFERMHRAKNAVLIEPDESGVGLSVSRRIIVLHGGWLTLDSKLNQGTLVTVILPKDSPKETLQN